MPYHTKKSLSHADFNEKNVKICLEIGFMIDSILDLIGDIFGVSSFGEHFN